MFTKVNKVSLLSLMGGIFCKIYDDLNDNNLFSHFGLEKNKEYINEYLKMIHLVILIYISSYSIYLLLIFSSANFLCFFLDNSAFIEPYEYSGVLLLPFILIIILSDNINEIKNLINYKALFIGLYYLVSIAFIDMYIFKDVEYGYKKLGVRGLVGIFFILMLIVNNFYNYLQDTYLSPIYYFIGYCITSCFFQIYLITKNKNIKKTKINIENKEKNKPKNNLEQKQKNKPKNNLEQKQKNKKK